ncbi:MAG TPA: DUF6600 domain-containing protein [Candidatus Acidoferrales bacterium]|nr:DUF6600 domain-containing protein [Candidatus Acidoferrales bacterium]
MRNAAKTLIIMAVAAATGAAQPPAADPPSRVARLNYMQGPVSFRPGSVDEWTNATLNYPLYNGDHLWADMGGQAELHIGSTAVRLGSQTALAVLNLDDRMVQLSLTGGVLNVHMRALGQGESFEVDTPNAAVTLLRPGDYRFQVDEGNALTVVTVNGGDAEVTAGGRAFALHPRDSARLTGADSTFASEINIAAGFDSFDRWCQDRDRREEQSQSARYVGREMTGYEDLDAHGAWTQAPDYGWVWRPTVVAAGWAPYRFGHWVWVEPWGWTWVDDAPWGFAPFHYGRWAMYGGGWVWVPGTMVARPVYAPALVAFVGGGGFSVAMSFGGGAGVAWFPLGPREVYHPAYHVSEVYVRQVNITHVNVTNVNVTNVNVTNVRYVNQNVTGAVTAVPQAAFVGARPVNTAAVAVPANAVARAQVVGTAAPVAPERASVLGRPAPMGRVAAPPPQMADRAVVARTAPPPPPVSFAAKQQALQANPGRPIDPAAAESLRRTDRMQGAPVVHSANPGGFQQPAMQNNPSQPSAPQRNDRPNYRQQQGQQPQGQQQPGQQEPRTFGRPVQQQQQQQQQQQPRSYDRPAQQPQSVQTPRGEQHQETHQQRQEERKQQPRRGEGKEEKKQ